MFFLCFKIFLARICDVSLGTIRTIEIVKGNKIRSCLIAFFELLIWFYAAKEALVTDINPIYVAISYSLGYTTGTYIGMIMNDILNSKTYTIEVILNKLTNKNKLYLNQKNYLISIVNTIDNRYIINAKLNKKSMNNFIKDIRTIDSTSIISIIDTHIIENKI